MVDAVVDAIISSGKTGEVGDGKIIVYDVQEVVRIRTGEKGSEAV
jgi:nitrogen regulatory protein PII